MRARAEIVELRQEELGFPDEPCQVRRMVVQDPDQHFTLVIERCDDGQDPAVDHVGVCFELGDHKDLRVTTVLYGAQLRRFTELPAFITAAMALAQARGWLNLRSPEEVARA